MGILFIIIINMNFEIRVLTGGPLSELRDFERKYLVAELVHLYELNDETAESVIKVILERVDSQLAKGYLCNFLFDDHHRRWEELLDALNGYTYLAVPLLNTLLHYNTVSDVVAFWDVLLKSANVYFVGRRQ